MGMETKAPPWEAEQWRFIGEKTVILSFSCIFSANIASQDYYKKSVEALRNHQLASDTVGKPIRIPYLNLARNDIRVGHRTAQARMLLFHPEVTK